MIRGASVVGGVVAASGRPLDGALGVLDWSADSFEGSSGSPMPESWPVTGFL
ncbi:hypothetical protein [Nocardia niwae]|uniref:Uncharacterized protein n=1 Tax=Nocardia niwae TaxID=626084 RepID=A0ABV2X355_9NOCA